jgi:hypothetical protein
VSLTGEMLYDLVNLQPTARFYMSFDISSPPPGLNRCCAKDALEPSSSQLTSCRRGYMPAGDTILYI